MSSASLQRAACAALVALLGACGGGGGGGDGSFKFEVSNVDQAAFAVTNGPPGGIIAGLNVPVTLFFNAPVDPTTVGGGSIQVVSIVDPVGVATAPAGIIAQLSYEVFENTVRLRPIVEFSPQQVVYGFVANGLYEISFGSEATGQVVRGMNGEPLSNPGTTFFFRTPLKGFDFNPGFPQARAFLVDDAGGVALPETIVDGQGGAATDGDLTEEVVAFFGNPVEIEQTSPALEVPVDPVRDMLFVFDDAVLPASLVSAADGTSDALEVLLNTAPLPTFSPTVFPATYTIIHQQADLTVVRWDPKIVAYPPDGAIVVSVGANVQDLACNTKASLTGNADPDLEVVLFIEDVPDTTIFSVLEPFSSSANADASKTTALWASPSPGLLRPILGGGTGADGPFFIDPIGTADDPRTTTVPLAAKLDFTTRTVLLPTVEQIGAEVFEPVRYHFSSFFLPPGWTLLPLTDRDGDGEADPEEFVVESPGHPLDGEGAPLQILSVENLRVDGLIDVSGDSAPRFTIPVSVSDPLYADYRGLGGDGAIPSLAAGAGGGGGDVLLVIEAEEDGAAPPVVAIPLQSPHASPAFFPSDGLLRGVTGRSSSLTATTLTDPLNDYSILTEEPFASQIAAGEILLQPNVGVGSAIAGNSGSENESIDENHPTFVVESVAVLGGQTTFTVVSGPGAPTLTQPSDNIGKPPIARSGDCYLIGPLAGRDGTDLLPFGRQGFGSEPYVVVNEGPLGITTTGGGGGGGGAIEPGMRGEDDGPASDPDVDQRGGSGGLSLDESPGAQGGLGTVRGTCRVVTGTEVDVVTQTAGRPLGAFGPGELAGVRLIANAELDGWIFDVVSFDGTTFTLAPITLDELDIDLLDGPGLAGPGLVPGQVVPFVLVPSLEVGGAGGGGTGVSVTGTVNLSVSSLPALKPGAGGGAGGSAVLLETASNVVLGGGAEVLARGGSGGDVKDLLGNFAGGGGGGGGNVVLRAGGSIEVGPGVRVSVEGGDGGGVAGAGRGGRGGAGYIRIETGGDILTAQQAAAYTTPPVTESSLGRLLGQPRGRAQSRFYQVLVANPEYDGIIVDYLADTNADGVLEPLRWAFTDTGVFGGPGDFEQPPFRILVNSVGLSGEGSLDLDSVDDAFYLASDLVSGRTGLVHDPTRGKLLYARGRGTTRIDVLDPVDFTLSGAPVFLPDELASSVDPLDVISMTLSDLDREIFLLERASRSVHVIDADTGAFRRTITLPRVIQGPLAFHPFIDRLLLVDNESNRLLVVRSVDPFAPAPFMTDFIVHEPQAIHPLLRDGVVVDVELTGLAFDPATESIWGVDALHARLTQFDMRPGLEGTSPPGVLADARLTSDGEAAVMSSVATDGATLFLVHAVDPVDTTAVMVDPASVDLLGADLVLPAFDAVLPTGSRSLVDGDMFLRFRLELDSGPPGGPFFDRVRIDAVTVLYENKLF